MVKKRVKEKSIKNNSNDLEKSAPKADKKNLQTSKSRWWQWLVFIVLVIIIISLVLVLVLNKGDKEKEISPCEKANDSCFEDSCPSGYAEIDTACSNGKVCCKKIVPVNTCEKYGNTCYLGSCPSQYGQVDLACVNAGDVCCKKIVQYENQTSCEKQNYLCFKSIVPEPGCPSGWLEVGFGCRLGEICCQEIKNQSNVTKVTLSGYIRLKQGNCMPPIGPECKNELINTQIALFGRTYQSSMDGKYYRPIIGPRTLMNSNVSGMTGYYRFEIEPGEYSFFVRDPLHENDYYCNNFDSKGNACYLNISISQTLQIIIDHSTQ